MRIWFDLRTINTNSYFAKFIYAFLEELKEFDKENIYTIYTSPINYYNFIELSGKYDIKSIKIEAWSLEDQFAGLKFFNEENLNCLVFFSHLRPYFYKKRNFVIVETIKDLLYPKHKSSFRKYSELFIHKLSYKKAWEIIWFSKDVITWLNEKLNIKESKISVIHPFFINSRKNENFVDIRMKYNIVNDYIIYPWKNWQNKNLSRLIEAISRINNEDKINIDLVFLDKEIWDSLEIREIVLRNNIQNKVKFLSDLKEEDLYFYYFESIWVVYPSIYESFPIELSDSINFWIKIIASRIENIKNIFWNTIDYFAPMSVWELKSSILKLKEEKNNKCDYSEIKNNYKNKDFIKHFLERII